MNKKAAFLFLLLSLASLSAFSTIPDKPIVEKWVDSVYATLSYEERIGQLIISKNTNPEILKSIYNGELPIGGFFISSSNVSLSKALLYENQGNKDGLIWVFSDDNINKLNKVENLPEFPGEVSKAAIGNIATVKKLEESEANYFTKTGGNIFVQKEAFLENINGEFIFHPNPSLLHVAKQNELEVLRNGIQRQHGIISALNLNLSFDNYDFLKYIPNDLYTNELWENVKSNYSVLLLNQLNFKRGWNPDEFKKEIVKGLLRNKFEYEGVLAIDIQQFNAQFNKVINQNPVEVDLIRSGVDIIITEDPFLTYRILYSNWKKHEIRNSDIEDRVKNILRQKYLQSDRALIEHISRGLTETEDMIYEAYAESVTLVENEGDVIPFKNLERDYFASLSIGTDRLTVFQQTLDKYTGFTHFVLPANQINSDAFNSLINKLSAFDHVVVGIHAPFTKDMLSLLSALEMNTNVVTTVFDDNIPDEILSATNSLLITYENNDYVQEIVPQIIFGARECKGNLPIPIVGTDNQGIRTQKLQRLAYAKPINAGFDEQKLLEIDAIALDAINKGATPGCQILVAKEGKVVYEKSFGNYTYENNYPVTNRTIYDLASITKVAATTQAIMFLADQGVLDLHQKLSYYLPELESTNKGDLIISDILTHQSGLKAFMPFWYQTIDFENLQIPFYADHPNEEYQLEVGLGMYGSLMLKDSLYAWTVKSELRKKPKRSRFEPYNYKYSDLGFYLMYVLAERLLNQPMEEFLAQNIYEPMGMSSTTFNPLCKFPITNIAPTENDKTFRHSLVWGTVHDQVAAMNGGISGHAGLFGNAIDLAKIGQMHLQGGAYGGQQFFSPGIINEFTTSQNNENRRGLGWDKPTPQDHVNNPTSVYSSASTFGHRGFTGTVVWVDPEQDLIYVFLSNRIYPNMSNGKLNELDIRKKIHDVVYESIINFEPGLN